MTWKAEPVFKKLLGLKGLKAIMLTLLDEVNVLRVEAGLPERTVEQAITAVTNKLASIDADEDTTLE